MVFLSSINGHDGRLLKNLRNTAFRGKDESVSENQEQKEGAKLLYEERKNHPFRTSLKIQKDKLVKAFTEYPAKGFSGSKNANFYEFLTMGIAPYLIGSGMIAALYNLANKHYDKISQAGAAKAGKTAALGVLFYGIFKTASKFLTEMPLNLKYGIDVNMPYRKKIDELPEERNKNKLVSYEYHKAYESVDYPYWDLFTNNKRFGNERESYFTEIGRKMGIPEEDLEYSGQKVKPLIRKKLVQSKFFTSLSTYLWAAIGVCIAAQKPFENLHFEKVSRYADSSRPKSLLSGFVLKQYAVNTGRFIRDFGAAFVQSCKDFIGADKDGIKSFIVNKFKKDSLGGINPPSGVQKAGRALLGAAAAAVLSGNLIMLTDFNKRGGRKPSAAASLIDDSKQKAVC